MIPSMISRRLRWAPILVVVTLAALALVAARSLREPVLSAAGWALVVIEPVASADIIVVSLDSGGAGVLEAADLVQSGVSKRVAVFMDPRVEKTRSSSAGGSLTKMGRQSKFAN